ncbi:MAG: bile acid:sodium symporter family protein [Aureliella sp.]
MALLILLPLGVLGANWLAPLNRFAAVRTLIVCLVMGLMALPIPFELIRQSLARPWPSLLASIINMGIIPLMAFAAAATLPHYLGGGLIVAACIPCTLASAAVWTRRGGGDDTVAILVTLITNLSCVVVTPLWLVALLGQRVDLQVGPLIWELFLMVLVPMAVAQSLRLSRPVAAWSERHKLSLALTCQIGILYMVLLGAIQMGQHMQAGQPASSQVEAGQAAAAVPSAGVGEVLWTVILVAVVHLLSMALGWQVAARTGIARPQQIGVAISGSQKTLMIGLKMAIDSGVSIIPMVAYHVGQLLMDTFIADRWRAAGALAEQKRAQAAEEENIGDIAESELG